MEEDSPCPAEYSAPGSWFLLHDNAPVHRAVAVQEFLARKKVCVLNALKPELNPICYLLVLLGAHHFLHVSRIRVK